MLHTFYLLCRKLYMLKHFAWCRIYHTPIGQRIPEKFHFSIVLDSQNTLICLSTYRTNLEPYILYLALDLYSKNTRYLGQNVCGRSNSTIPTSNLVLVDTFTSGITSAATSVAQPAQKSKKS